MATNFLTGLAAYGLNIFPTYVPTTIYQGNVFFVGNNNASTQFATASVDDPSYGKTPGLPFNTINYASTKCYPNQGDVIIVLPGHVEAVTSATSLTLGVAGVSIIGIGNMVNRPKITIGGATTATINVTAANVALYNVKIDSTGINAIVAPITVTAGGFYMESCEHYFAKTSFVSLLGISFSTIAAATNFRMNNCYMHGDPVANCTNYIQCVGGDSMQITNSQIIGNFTTSLGCVNNITAVCTNILISNNVLQNLTASSTIVVTLFAGSTGSLINNRVQILSGSTPFVGTGCMWNGNYISPTIATVGTLL
jgi:hypothetical protein